MNQGMRSPAAWKKSEQTARGQQIVLIVCLEGFFGHVTISTTKVIIVSYFKEHFRYFC